MFFLLSYLRHCELLTNPKEITVNNFCKYIWQCILQFINDLRPNRIVSSEISRNLLITYVNQLFPSLALQSDDVK